MRSTVWYATVCPMAKPLSEIAEQELATFRGYQAAVSLNLQRAEASLERFIAALNLPDDAARPTGRSNVRCVREWTEWLRANGPEYKGVITEKTGVRFKEQGTPYTIKWFDYMETQPMEHVSDDTLVRFTVHRAQRGGSPVVYALWSQRYDVREKFGVGPERPKETALLGVVQPEQENAPTDLERWADSHSAIWAAVRMGSKPTAEQRELLRETCPDGVDVNTAIALAAADRLSELTG